MKDYKSYLKRHKMDYLYSIHVKQVSSIVDVTPEVVENVLNASLNILCMSLGLYGEGFCPLGIVKANDDSILPTLTVPSDILKKQYEEIETEEILNKLSDGKLSFNEENKK